MLFSRSTCLSTALIFAVGIATAACGSNNTPTTPGSAVTSTSSTVANTPSSSKNSNATEISVNETEYSITLSKTTFLAGDYLFTVTNSGNTSHDLIINGPGLDKVKFSPDGLLSPGQSVTHPVTLQTGTYEIWCDVDSHKSLGMDLTITVT